MNDANRCSCISLVIFVVVRVVIFVVINLPGWTLKDRTSSYLIGFKVQWFFIFYLLIAIVVECPWYFFIELGRWFGRKRSRLCHIHRNLANSLLVVTKRFITRHALRNCPNAVPVRPFWLLQHPQALHRALVSILRNHRDRLDFRILGVVVQRLQVVLDLAVPTIH